MRFINRIFKRNKYIRRSWDIVEIWGKRARMKHKSKSIFCFELICNYIKPRWKYYIDRGIFHSSYCNFKKIIDTIEVSKILFKFNSCIIINDKFFRKFVEFFFYIVDRVNNLSKWVFLFAIWTNYLLCFICCFGQKIIFTTIAEKFYFYHSKSFNGFCNYTKRVFK